MDCWTQNGKACDLKYVDHLVFLFEYREGDYTQGLVRGHLVL